MPSLEFNQRAAIAASLEELAKDRDIPVYIEGDIYMGGFEYDNMDKGEAARIAVDTVLDHPYVKTAMKEREDFWRALKWLVTVARYEEDVPDEIASTLWGAMDAAAFDRANASTILGDE